MIKEATFWRTVWLPIHAKCTNLKYTKDSQLDHAFGLKNQPRGPCYGEDAP